MLQHTVIEVAQLKQNPTNQKLSQFFAYSIQKARFNAKEYRADEILQSSAQGDTISFDQSVKIEILALSPKQAWFHVSVYDNGNYILITRYSASIGKNPRTKKPSLSIKAYKVEGVDSIECLTDLAHPQHELDNFDLYFLNQLYDHNKDKDRDFGEVSISPAGNVHQLEHEKICFYAQQIFSIYKEKMGDYFYLQLESNGLVKKYINPFSKPNEFYPLSEYDYNNKWMNEGLAKQLSTYEPNKLIKKGTLFPFQENGKTSYAFLSYDLVSAKNSKDQTIFYAIDNRELGNGGTAVFKPVVYKLKLAYDENNNVMDLQVIERTKKSQIIYGAKIFYPTVDIQDVINEFYQDKQFPHLKVKCMLIDKDSGVSLIIMRRFEGKELFDVLVDNMKRLLTNANENMQFALYYGAKIFEAYKKEIVDNGYAHRDLKLENIMWESHDDSVHFIDVGFALQIKQTPGRGRESLGTPGYMDFHVLHERIYSNNKSVYTDQKSDMFSLGIILAVLLICRTPDVESRHSSVVITGTKEYIREIYKEIPIKYSNTPEFVGAIIPFLQNLLGPRKDRYTISQAQDSFQKIIEVHTPGVAHALVQQGVFAQPEVIQQQICSDQSAACKVT